MFSKWERNRLKRWRTTDKTNLLSCEHFFSTLRVTGFVTDFINTFLLLDVVLYVDKAAAVDGKRGHGALLRLCRLLFPLPQALQAKAPSSYCTISLTQCCGSGIRGPFWPLDPWSGMGKKSRSGSRVNIPDPISDSLETIFWVKNTWILWCDSGSGIRNPFDLGSGMEKFVYGINIPDTQHWPDPSFC